MEIKLIPECMGEGYWKEIVKLQGELIVNLNAIIDNRNSQIDCFKQIIDNQNRMIENQNIMIDCLVRQISIYTDDLTNGNGESANVISIFKKG